MTKIEKVIKLLAYIRKHSFYSHEYDHYIIRANYFLYEATWKESFHGSVEDYKETLLTDEDLPPDLIKTLEDKVFRIKLDIEEAARKAKIIEEFYNS